MPAYGANRQETRPADTISEKPSFKPAYGVIVEETGPPDAIPKIASLDPTYDSVGDETTLIEVRKQDFFKPAYGVAQQKTRSPEIPPFDNRGCANEVDEKTMSPDAVEKSKTKSFGPATLQCPVPEQEMPDVVNIELAFLDTCRACGPA